MAKVIYEIVSNVDTIIVLKDPSIHFAPWEDPKVVAAREVAKRVKEEIAARELVEEERRWAVPVSGKKKKKGKKGNATPPRAPEEEDIAPPPTNNSIGVEEVGGLGTIGFSFEEREAFVVSEKMQMKGEKVAFQIPEDEILQSVDGKPSATGLSVGEGSNTADQSIFGGGRFHAKLKITDYFNMRETSTPNAGPSNGVENNIAVQMESEPTDEVTVVPEPLEEEGIHFHVCSGNLMSASPWFNRVLKRDGWMESNRNEEDRRFRISAEDWDEEAFLILMNIFHLRNRDVPRTVSLEMLAKIAVLVDYYDCGEAIELYTDMWIIDLRANVKIPTTYCRELMLWIWVSWVFRLSGEFELSTIVAIKQSTESIRNLALPIPSWITDDIDNKRYQAIEGVISGLHDLLDTYRSVDYYCPYGDEYSFRCGSMLLGALSKEMHSANVLLPRPEVPFPGQRFEDVCVRLLAMKSTEWCSERFNEKHGCDLVMTVHNMINALVAGVEGLTLSGDGNGGRK